MLLNAKVTTGVTIQRLRYLFHNHNRTGTTLHTYNACTVYSDGAAYTSPKLLAGTVYSSDAQRTTSNFMCTMPLQCTVVLQQQQYIVSKMHNSSIGRFFSWGGGGVGRHRRHAGVSTYMSLRALPSVYKLMHGIL